MHQCAGVTLDRYLDAGRLGEVKENLRWHALGKLGAVKIDADMDAAICGAYLGKTAMNDNGSAGLLAQLFGGAQPQVAA